MKRLSCALLPLLAGASLALAADPQPIAVNPDVPMRPDAAAATAPLLRVTAVTGAASDKLLAATLTDLQASRDALKVLHIAADCSTEEFDPATGTWLPGEGILGEGYFETAQPQRTRVEVERELSPALTRGGVPFPQKFVATWDGAESREWTINRPRLDSGAILSGNSHRGVALLGETFAYPLEFLPAAGQILDDQRQIVVTPAAAAARRVVLNGHQPATEITLRYSAGGVPMTFTYWFDPAHSHVLLGCAKTVDAATPQQTVTHAIIEAAPTLFYTQSATAIAVAPGQPLRRTTFHATRVKANEAVPADLFTLDFPPGMSVYVEHR
jgi:hypothetical protein